MIKFLRLRQAYHRNETVFFSLRPIYYVAQDFSFPVIDDVNFDHRMKVVSAKFLHSKVTCFPIAIKKCFLERFLETMETSHFSLDF